ncbi:MAG: response regulator [Defluviitaleaceae bacterium]|nr:response regulator [Defluviitaleaceae bacterium]
MLKNLKNITIATRLVASFALVITIFVVYVGITSYYNAQIDRLQRHSSEFLVARLEILMLHHQEFAEMKRLLREAYMNDTWMESASETVWRSFDARLTATQVSMTELSNAYFESIRIDEILPERPNDSRIHIMGRMMEEINSVYEIYRDNFFWDGNGSHDHANALERSRAGEVMVGALRQLHLTHRDMAQEDIYRYRGVSNGVTAMALIVAIVLAVWLAYLMLRTFKDRIKAIEAEASLVAAGNFETALKNEGNDEISRVFGKMVRVFTGLIDEIEKVSKNNKDGDSRTRINENLFEGEYYKTAVTINAMLDNVTAAEERAQLMLDGNPVASYLIDENLNILDCNAEAVNLLDFTSKEEAIAGVGYIFDAPNLKNPFLTAMQTGYTIFGWDLKKPSGIVVPCEVTFVRFSLNGKNVIVAYFLDMSAFYQMLEQEQRTLIAEENSHAKTRFLARMSHEIRTPISAVLGISEIQLRNAALPTAIEEAFVTIHDSASVLLSIINDILDISKIEAGKMDLIVHKYDTASFIMDTIQLHLVYSGNKNLEFIVDVDENIPSTLYGDELRVKQILNNILSNAFKYTDTGNVMLDISCDYDLCKENEDVVLVLKVKDTGRGMHQEQLDMLLDEYTRFHEHQDRFTQGTGLGMAIANSLIKLMDGEIEVQSKAGEGSLFTVRLPQRIAADGVIGKHTAINLHNYETGALTSIKKTNFIPESMPYGSVLIVDDVPTNLFVAKGLMDFYDLNIETANNGFAAINAVKSGKTYDIIFMDHMMPDLDGMQTTKILREMGYNAPIVALTANALIGQAEEFMSNGFDDFISKPIQTTRLNDILNKYVRDIQPEAVVLAARESSEDGGIKASKINDFLKGTDYSYKLNRDFANSQKTAMDDIKKALDADDFKTAHRLAHTLKGLAGLIDAKDILHLAQKAELAFNKKEKSEEILSQLNEKMVILLEKIESTYPARRIDVVVLDKQKAKEVFDILTPLLQSSSFSALELIEDLAQIPKTNELIEQIEAIDFDVALDTLSVLRDDLGV